MILIDDRTGSKELHPLLPSSQLERLDYGDVMWMGEGPSGLVPVGVERKTVLDFLGSTLSGRLSGHQLVGMLETFHTTYLVIEGAWRASPEDGLLQRQTSSGWWVTAELGTRRFMAREFIQLINTLQVMVGLHTWMTPDIHATAQLLTALHRWWSKPWDKHRSHLQFHQKAAKDAVSLMKPSLVVRVAAELEGVGMERARAIGRLFPSVTDLVAACPADLQEVPGIGKTLATRIIYELAGKQP
jgi:ERCC4-type nuclease